MPPPTDDFQSKLIGSTGTLCLLVQAPEEARDLERWTADHIAWIDDHLLRRGAILFRGFDVTSPEAFKQVAGNLCGELLAGNREHEPVTVDGLVQTPVFYPPDKKLLWHNENSFNREWPLRLAFCCIQPADERGETPLVDSRLVLRHLDAAIVQRFAERGVMYIRHYGGGLGLDWRTVFGTDDRTRVEAQCRANGLEFEWRGTEELRTRCVRPAVVRHPLSGEWSWFNQAQHWHVSCLDAETREALLDVFDEDDLPRSCRYGDGTPIEDSTMKEILGVYQSLETSFAWRRGDVLLLDNVLMAHGRNPFSGRRQILVALGDTRSFS